MIAVDAHKQRETDEYAYNRKRKLKSNVRDKSSKYHLYSVQQ